MIRKAWANRLEFFRYRMGFYFSGIGLTFPFYRKWVINQFHKLAYGSYLLEPLWLKTYWLGVPVLKFPLDLWVYQEMIYELKPDVLIETGSYHGGSALYLAIICDLVQKGRVISVDIDENVERAEHSRITYLIGSSIDPKVIETVKGLIEDGETVMVLLDSTHHKSHVLQELVAYSQLVSLGSYLVVEDTNLNGHPIWPGFGEGPAEAVRTFLSENEEFEIDRTREKYYISFNPGGFLKRVR